MYNFDGNGFGKSKLTGKQKIIIGCVVAVVVAALVLLCVRGCSGSAGAKSKQISLANFYYDNGEFDRALDALQKLFLKNPDDKEIQDLMKKIIAAKGEDSAGSSSNQNVNVNIDTDGLQSSLDSMKSELARTNAENVRQQKEMAELMRKQQENAALEKERQEQLKAQQEEQKAIAKAAEEQRKKDEAARKAKEEELARKNAKLKAEIAAVNDFIQQGKSALNSGNIDSALNNFANAQKSLPVSDGEPAFSAGKNSEMAGALYDASLNASNPDEKKKLQDAAVEYASKAVALDPKNAESQYILGMDAFDKKNYQKALEHLTKAAANDTSKNYLYYYNLGRVQYMMKKFTEAKYSFTTTCQLNGNFAPARYNLGLTDNKLNDSKSALAEFRRARAFLS